MDMVFFIILNFGAKFVAALTSEAIAAATSDEICALVEDSKV